MPMAAPTPEPTAEPTATPAAVEPAPDAAETPAPELSAEPTAAPDPAAAVQAMIDALPDKVTDDNAEAVEQALTDIDDAKQSLTDDELAGLDLTRYDAAANALLALWGEAATDAVEMLDNYATPTPGSDGYYSIADADDLRWFASQVNSGNNTINAKLTADITINNKVLDEKGELNTGANFTPWTLIGTNTKPFIGTFDGCNFTISGLHIDVTTDYVGLFGCVGNGGTVKNVTLADSYVSGSYYVGGICGQNKGGTVQNCHNTGKVSGSWYVGGVCGSNTGSSTIQEWYNTGDVSGTGFKVSDVCGYNYDGGTVKGTVENCYYLAGTSANAVGNGTEGTNCASKTKLQFQNGDVAYQLQKDLGEGSAQVWGQRIGTDKTPVLSSNASYKVYQTKADSPCKVPYCNSETQKLDHNYVNGVCSRCGEHEPPDFVDGYYQITNQWQLRWFANKVNSGESNINARLMNDITMDSTEWTPIGTSSNPFAGNFDGNGHTISKRTCTDKSKNYVGLVGFANGATIQNVTVQGSSFNGHIYIGAVCGYITGGTIKNCHAVGTTIGDSDRDDDSQYWGGIVGYMTGNNVVTDCTNSGTVSGCWYLGGIAGFAGTNTTVQRCFNSGAVTGRHAKFGGIVGQTYNATVQDCGNTGAVSEFTPSSGSQYGGIVGLAESDSTIQNCYNADKNTAAKICGRYSCDLSNCYYLPNDTGSSGSTVTGITAKTAEQFASGEVAYLLQGNRTESVWGQTLTGANKQNYPVLNGVPVYQGTPCTGRYSNKPNDTLNHNYENGNCIYCGQPEIAYTVTIPATVELGNAANATAIISAENVTLPTDKTLKVTVNGPFTATLVGTTDMTAQYTIKNGSTALESGDPVLTAKNGESPKIPLTFVKPDAAPYAGSYTGTVTFEVSVGTPTT